MCIFQLFGHDFRSILCLLCIDYRTNCAYAFINLYLCLQVLYQTQMVSAFTFILLLVRALCIVKFNVALLLYKFFETYQTFFNSISLSVYLYCRVAGHEVRHWSYHPNVGFNP